MESTTPSQVELPFAIVRGEPVTAPPHDLYIPPDALKVFLESFEGPLDLLLYLIKRQNLDILDIRIADITRQYMQYIDMMQELQLELVGEYLAMAAILAEIKSRMLLPRPVEIEEEDDPRAELIRHLLEYERFKNAAEQLDELPRMDRDLNAVVIEFPYPQAVQVHPEVSLDALLNAFREVTTRAELFAHHHIQREPLSVRERMGKVLDRVRTDQFISFHEMFSVEEGRAGVVVTLLAILELLKGALIEMVQNEPGGPIYIKGAT